MSEGVQDSGSNGAQNSSDMSLEQADALIDQIEGGRAPAGGITDESNIPKVEKETEHEINWRGKPVRLPLSKVLDHANKGYDYSQRMAEFNKKSREFEQRQKSMETDYASYVELDKAIRTTEGAAWWQHVNEAWKNRANGVQQPQQAQQQSQVPQELLELISPLKRELDDLRSFKTNLEEERKLKDQKDVDDRYLKDREDVIKANPDVDFDTPDESGESLEYKILKHANDTGIKSFKSAWRDLDYDKRAEREQSKARQAVTKGISEQERLGIRKSNKPFNKSQGLPMQNGRHSYNLTPEELKEFGINIGE